jgi:hypothetical protein
MGESNLSAMNMIAELTGSTPIYGETEDGRQSLTIGDVVIVAKHFGLWSEPTAYQHNDRMLTVGWGGQSATLVKGDDGSWVAQVVANPARAKARFVD